MLFPEPSEFLFTAGYDSPLGHLDLAASERGLLRLAFPAPRKPVDGSRSGPAPRWIEAPERFRAAFRQLDEYFGGRRRVFDLPLDLRGPEFHRRCWQALLTIPYGQTCSYAELAAAVGSPMAARAVGQANHNNPVAILVPCHRVIGADGTLGGYGGGLAAKQFLLRLEGAAFRGLTPEQGSLFGGLAV